MRIPILDPLSTVGRSTRLWTAGVALACSVILFMVGKASDQGWAWPVLLLGLAGAGLTVGCAVAFWLREQRLGALLPHANEMLRRAEMSDLVGQAVAVMLDASATEVRDAQDAAVLRRLAGKAAKHWTGLSDRWLNPTQEDEGIPAAGQAPAAPAKPAVTRRGPAFFAPALVDFIREPARTALDDGAWVAFLRDMGNGALPLQDPRSVARAAGRLRCAFVAAVREALDDKSLTLGEGKGHAALELILLAGLLRGTKVARRRRPTDGPAAGIGTAALTALTDEVSRLGEAVLVRLSPADADRYAVAAQRFREVVSQVRTLLEDAPAVPLPAAQAPTAHPAKPGNAPAPAAAAGKGAVGGAPADPALPAEPARYRPALPPAVSEQGKSFEDYHSAIRRGLDQLALRREDLTRKLPLMDFGPTRLGAVEAVDQVAIDARRGEIEAQAVLSTGSPIGAAEYLRRRRDRRVEQLRALYEDIIADNARLAAVSVVMGDLPAAQESLSQIVTGRPGEAESLSRLIDVLLLQGNLNDAERLSQRLIDMAGDDEAGQAVAYNHFGQIAQARGDLDQAEEMFRRALSIAERLASQHGVAVGYAHLGLLHLERDDDERAAEMFRGALAASESAGPLHVKAMACGHLGMIYRGRGDLLRAEPMLRDAADTFAEAAAPAAAATHLNILGLIYKQRGDLDRAEQAFRDAVSLNERAHCEEGLAANFGNLSDVFQARGDTDNAERLLRRSIELFERSESQEGVAVAYGKLGTTLYARGDYDGAVNIFQIALAIDEKLGDRPRTALDLANLGLALQARGDAREAEPVLIQALAISEEIGPKKSVASNCNNLGLVYERLGDWDRAEQLYRRALSINENLGQPEAEELARNYTNLGNLCLVRGNIKQAEDLLTKALDLHEHLGSPQGIAANCGNLGQIYLNRGELEPAEDMYRSALSALARLGNDEGLAVAHAKLAGIYRARGDLPSAAEMYKEAIGLDQRRGPAAEPDLAANCGNLGLVYRTLGQLDLAETMLRRSLALYEKLGREDQVATTYSHLGSLEIERGHAPNAKQLWSQALALYQKMGRQDTVRSLRGRIESLATARA